ncbi:DUF305 domain-containing protein (plasmid) [Natrinema zhouii]|uniref:DUF305 domain-containing protein n=1 Tax=Natrinema zhouii TaxID=1710539 RepID=UPI001CFF8A93|nr:DUF305 domain-containing protein [Natrinema zhouii]UHQ99278.1 DUF305 domain-containing protein [Natrinema zhouii]
MTQNEDQYETVDDNLFRRSVLKTGMLTSSGLALGLSGATPVSAGEESTGAKDTQDLNLADVSYLQLLAYHHRSAIQMGEMALERVEHQELHEFLEMSIQKQTEGIQRIKDILSDAGIDPGEALDINLDDIRVLVTAIPGEPKPNELAYLESLEGEEFDLRFLEVFPYHHHGAIQMSKEVMKECGSTEVEKLANNTIETQLEGITQMYQWYLEWI